MVKGIIRETAIPEKKFDECDYGLKGGRTEQRSWAKVMITS